MGFSLGYNPYTWRSVFSSKMVLKEGSRWRIGDGSNINIWHGPWLRKESSYYPTSPISVGFEILKAVDMIQHDTKIKAGTWTL